MVDFHRRLRCARSNGRIFGK